MDDSVHSNRRVSTMKLREKSVMQLFQILQVISVFAFFVIISISKEVDANDAADRYYWQRIITELQGDDYRLFRWNAEDETAEKQLDTSLCGKNVIEQAMSIIMDDKSLAEESDDPKRQEHLTVVGKAMEYLTWCITDNPANRAIFALEDSSNKSRIHAAVVGWIERLKAKVLNEDAFTERAVLAMAGHVIYITSFANSVNHQGYINAGAVKQLAEIVKMTAFTSTTTPEAMDEGMEQIHTPFPIVTMWSLAALANLAASYCDTQDDGRCYWSWAEDGLLELEPESHPINSDGTAVRKEILGDADLMQILINISCLLGPVPTTPTLDENGEEVEVVMPGVNAAIGRDEYSTNIIAWAAASVLKNVAILTESHTLLEEHITCFCYLANSLDWLEENKGAGVLYHIRRGYPCWFTDEHDEDGEPLGHSLCIDSDFYHADHFTCNDYSREEAPLDEECDNIIDRNGILATDACCACGGGTIVTSPSDEDGGFEDEL